MPDIPEDKPKRKYTKRTQDNPNSLRNLHTFKPGEGGRKKGSKNYKTVVQETFLNQFNSVIDPKTGKTQTDAFIEKFMKDAMREGTFAYRMVAERFFQDDMIDQIDKQLNKAKKEDIDFLQYRVLKRAFDIQQQALLSKSKDIVIMAGRRSGKSEFNKLLAITTVLEENKRVLIIGLTITKTQQIYENDIKNMLTEIGIQFQLNSTDATFYLPNKEDPKHSIIQFGGSSNKLEREKYRGLHWDLITVDEAQSHKDLGMFCKDILYPMLYDTQGRMVLTGSGPRTRGTYFEKLYLNPTPSSLRLNWNMSKNPFIKDYEHVLEMVREQHKLSENDPLYIREYLGQIAYDDAALVFQHTDKNYFDDEYLSQWISNQAVTDIKFLAGLDYGYKDYDAFIIIAYSEKSNEKFLIFEHKMNGQGVTELAEAILKGKEYVQTNPMFQNIVNRSFIVYADTNEQKITKELNTRYGIYSANAIKHDKAFAIQQLQDEVRKGNLKFRQDSLFKEECLRTIYRRDETDNYSVITKEIDDETFHPDMMDAVLYSLRNYWLTHEPNHEVILDPNKEQQKSFWETFNENHLASDSQLF